MSAKLIFSQGFGAKLIRKRRRALLSGAEKYQSDKAKRKIRVNLWIVSLSFLFLFTAFHGLQNLQSSINGRLGTDSLSYVFSSLSPCKLTLLKSAGIELINPSN